jgi:hypothetical protein
VGTVLKILGLMFIGFWLMVGVGCTMLVRAVEHNRGSGYSLARDRNDVIEAVQDGRVDFANMPSASEVRSGDSVRIPLRDGTSRMLGNTLADRIVREALADRMSRPSSSYDPNFGREDAYANRPHFKPGEPMVNPNPGAY